MIVEADAQDHRCFRDAARGLHVALARLVIAGRVVVDEDDPGGTDLQRALHDFARIGRRFPDRAFPDQIVRHQLVLRGEEKDTEALVDQIAHVRLQIIEQLARGGDDRPVLQLEPQAVEQGGLDIPQIACRLGPDAACAVPGAGGERGGQRAEFGDQRVGPGSGLGRPGPSEERVQEGSAPNAFSRR